MKKLKVLAILLLSTFILSSFMGCSSQKQNKRTARHNHDEEEEEDDDDDEKGNVKTEKAEPTTDGGAVVSEVKELPHTSLSELDTHMSGILGQDYSNAKSSLEEFFGTTFTYSTEYGISDRMEYCTEYRANLNIDEQNFDIVLIQYSLTDNKITAVGFKTDNSDFDTAFNMYGSLYDSCKSQYGEPFFEGDHDTEDYLRHAGFMDGYGNEIYIMGGAWSEDATTEIYNVMYFNVINDGVEETGSNFDYDLNGITDFERITSGYLGLDYDDVCMDVVKDIEGSVYGDPVVLTMYESNRVTYTYDGYFTVGDLYFGKLSFECDLNDNSIYSIGVQNESVNVDSALLVYQDLKSFCESTYGAATFDAGDDGRLENSEFSGYYGDVVYIMGGSWSADAEALDPGLFMIIVALPNDS